MTDTPHIPGAEIADARLRELSTEAARQAGGAISFVNSEYDMAVATREIEQVFREALAARIVPEGWKLVPVKITLEMQKAYFDVIDKNLPRVEKDLRFGRFDSNREAYSAMLAASPAANVPPQVNEAVTEGHARLDAWKAVVEAGGELADQAEHFSIGTIAKRNTAAAAQRLAERVYDYRTAINRLSSLASPSPGTATAGASYVDDGDDYPVVALAERIIDMVQPAGDRRAAVDRIIGAVAHLYPDRSASQSRVERLETGAREARRTAIDEAALVAKYGMDRAQRDYRTESPHSDAYRMAEEIYEAIQALGDRS